MSDTPIAAYLRDLERALRANGAFDPAALAEIESHLAEAVAREMRNGLDEDAANAAALARFGPVQIVATAFEQARNTPMQKGLLAIAIALGLIIAFVDSRPGWDATGITAMTILVISGLIALLGFRRPWLLALAVGLWIPLYGIVSTQNPTSILALAFAFAGAYAGRIVRAGARKIAGGA